MRSSEKSRFQRFGLDAYRPILIFTGLFGMGVAQPILNLYGNNPEVFIANRSSLSQIIAFALIVILAPAVIAAAVWFISRKINRRAGVIVEMIVIVIAGFLLASVLGRHLAPESDLLLVPVVIAAGALGIYGLRNNPLRTWLTYLALMPVLSLVVFLGFSRSAELIWAPAAEAEKGTKITNPIPVVMLIFDELPLSSLLTAEKQINASLFPNFSRLAGSAYFLRNYATNSIATTDSVPIILSGKISEGAKPDSSDHPKTLFTLLGERYDMDVNESVTSLCPESVCQKEHSEQRESVEARHTDGSMRRLLSDAAVVYGHLSMPPFARKKLPAVSGQWGGFIKAPEATPVTDAAPVRTKLPAVSGFELPPAPAGGRPAWIRKWLQSTAEFAASKPQTLHYTHVMAPHIPWIVNPSGTVYPLPEQTQILVAGVEAGYWVENPAFATQGFQRHLSQLGAVDLLLGHYLDELERTGLWDEALVIVTADHGLSFEPGSHRRHVRGDNANALYRVPLFVHLPGQSSSVVRDEAAFALDILPTIIDVLGVSVDWDMEGLSLLGDLPQRRDHVYDHFSGDRVALEMNSAELEQELTRVGALIPARDSWESVAAVGPLRETVGKSLQELDAVVNPGMVVSFDGYDEGIEISERSGVVPTIIKGRVSIPDGYTAANPLMAINGSVRGTGFAMRDSGNTWVFSCHVPETAFRDGFNEVDIVVASPSGQWQHSVSGFVPKTEYRDQDGELLNIEPRGQRIVQIDSVKIDNGVLRVKGFTADTGNKITPDTLLVFYGDQLAYAAPPNWERGDVPIWFKSENLRRAGFDFELPADEIPPSAERVTLIASFPGRAVLVHALLPKRSGQDE